jgi:hypothetical protein
MRCSPTWTVITKCFHMPCSLPQWTPRLEDMLVILVALLHHILLLNAPLMSYDLYIIKLARFFRVGKIFVFQPLFQWNKSKILFQEHKLAENIIFLVQVYKLYTWSQILYSSFTKNPVYIKINLLATSQTTFHLLWLRKEWRFWVD